MSSTAIDDMVDAQSTGDDNTSNLVAQDNQNDAYAADTAYTNHQNTKNLHPQGHSLINLDRTNITKLLGSASQLQVSERRHGEATAICSRLAELNPQVAEWFKPKQEALAHLDLRMIVTPDKITDTPPTTTIDSFIVVSYCWHYPTWELPPCTADVAEGWKISRTMVNAVLSHRESPKEGVWIDQVCIDQSSDFDKTMHVGAMDIVYKSARRVVVLLEDIQLDTEEEYVSVLYRDWYMELCRVVKERELEGQEKSAFVDSFVPTMEKKWAKSGWEQGVLKGGLEGLGETERVKVFQAVGKRFGLKVLSARWFERAWCAHESRVARWEKVNSPLVLCFGPDKEMKVSRYDQYGNAGGEGHSTQTATAEVLSFEFRFVHYISMYLSTLPEDEPVTSEAIYDRIYASKKILIGTKSPDPAVLWQLWYRIQTLMPNLDPMGSTMQHLGSILSFGCQFKGDLVSIALNTSSIPLVFTGQKEIKDTSDVVWIFTALVLAMGDMVPLIADGPKLRGPRLDGGKDNTGPLATVNPDRKPWVNPVVSWAPSLTQGATCDILPIPKRSMITCVTKEYIELDMLLVTASPSPPTPDAQEKAGKIIQRHDLEALAEVLAAAAASEVTRKTELIRLATEKIRKCKPGPLHTFVKIWLAFGIDCGRDWMLRFADTMKKATEGHEDGMNWTHGTLGGDEESPVDQQLEEAARDLLACYEDEGGTGISSEEKGEALSLGAAKETKVDNEVIYTEADLKNTVRFLRTVIDSRLKFFTTGPRVMRLNASDYIMGVSTSNTAYYAIPLVVAHLPAWHKRGWIVEPFNPSDPPETLADMLPDPKRKDLKSDDLAIDVYPVLNSDVLGRRKPWADNKGDWRLRRREEVFGCQELDWKKMGHALGDGVNAVVLKKQRVYGAEDYAWPEIMEVAQRLEATLRVDEGAINGKEKESDGEGAETKV